MDALIAVIINTGTGRPLLLPALGRPLALLSVSAWALDGTSSTSTHVARDRKAARRRKRDRAKNGHAGTNKQFVQRILRNMFCASWSV